MMLKVSCFVFESCANEILIAADTKFLLKYKNKPYFVVEYIHELL